MNKISFEDAIKRIEEIVNILENGKTTLDESLQLFEEATELCSFCNTRLYEAKKKISSITVINTEKEEQ